MALQNPKDGFFSMGEHTHKVPMALFQENRQRLCAALKAEKSLPSKSVVLLQGGSDQGICDGDSSDVGPVFQQEAFFHWAFGVLEPDCYGAIDVDSGKSVIFIPRLPQEYIIFMGTIPTPEVTKDRYRVDEVRYTDELNKVLNGTLLLLNGINSDSGKQTRTAAFDGMANFKTDDKILYPVISELRVIKTEMELEALRYATKISAHAHMAVMREIKPGMREYHCEALFRKHCYFYGGLRHVCYTCIAAAGRSGAHSPLWSCRCA